MQNYIKQFINKAIDLFYESEKRKRTKLNPIYKQKGRNVDNEIKKLEEEQERPHA